MKHLEKEESFFPQKLQWMWNARYASWRIPDAEVFDYSREDFEKKAALFRQCGINAVIIAAFHFRWDWQYYWPRLLKILSNIVLACHKYNIKVIEHHSSTLKSHYPDKAERCQYIGLGNDWSRYPHFLKNLNTDPTIEGVRFSSMYQIDIRTGRSSKSYYHGYIFCPNNPDFQRLYFKYLENIYRVGVDGIMTDDIQFMPYTYSCGCKWCRKLFTKQTGYNIPETESDGRDFFVNFDNPAFRAFIRFRENSFVAHHRRVNEHFQKLGYVMARPNYCSSATTVSGPVGTGYDLEKGMPYFNTVFTEVCSGEDPLTCWAWRSSELKHKSALASRYKVPAMALFYCANATQGYFAWALSKTLGQNHWITGTGNDIHMESHLSNKGNVFQERHPMLFEKPSSCAGIAVLFSHSTMSNYQASSDQFYTHEYAGWCQQLFLNNMLFDVILDDDLAEKNVFMKYDLIILPNAACLSDNQVEAIREYVRNGGKIIATFETGHFDHHGNRRKFPALQDLFGIQDIGLVTAQNPWRVIRDNSFIGALPPYIDNRRAYRQIKIDGPGEVFLETVCQGLWMNSPVCIRTRFGKGEALYFAGYVGNQAMATYSLGVSGLKTGTRFGINKTNTAMIKILTQSVKGMIGNNWRLLPDKLPEGLLVGLYRHNKNYVLHLLNASGLQRKDGEFFGHNDKWKVAPCDAFKIRLQGFILKNAILVSPDFKQKHQVPMTKSGDGVVLTIQKNWLTYYSMIDMQTLASHRKCNRNDPAVMK